MIDERLAKGYARQMLRDIKPPAKATGKAIDRLYDNYSRNRKGQARAIKRLSKKHEAVISSTTPRGDRGTAKIIYWSDASYTVESSDYQDKDSLDLVMVTFESTRNGKTFNNIMGPVSLCTHAIRRWIERDLALPKYDLWQWLSHLRPIIIPAFLLNRVAHDNQDLSYLYRPVALPTFGGLFVGFIVTKGQDLEDGGCVRYFHIALRSFYGQLELDEDLQRFHAKLLDDGEETIAAHEEYGWDRLWQGQESALLEAMRT